MAVILKYLDGLQHTYWGFHTVVIVFMSSKRCTVCPKCFFLGKQLSPIVVCPSKPVCVNSDVLINSPLMSLLFVRLIKYLYYYVVFPYMKIEKNTPLFVNNVIKIIIFASYILDLNYLFSKSDGFPSIYCINSFG